ncbi:PREDICTED: uncharacterized protein LOC109192693 isoform X2 [Ipomoea nil]|uniref:uncharacterized protein LOC109192693 isoform X2 n=1 Tax=Ipomoea nil TaxID=35883 RepID=UPI000900A8FF|nr:PREDICTED: uncharacterized protein LOC109192693 isoform X2 [Ipomoea nil]
MEEEYSVDAAQLLQAATDFAYDPSPQSDVSAQEFLDRFPLPAVINALQAKSDYPGLEDALCDCLDKVFRTKYGASLIPHFMPFVVVGLGAPSQNVRRLACTTVSSLLDNTDETTAVYLILQNGVYPLLLSCLIDGDEQVAAAAIAAIKNLAGFTKGLDIIFPASSSEQTHLGDLAAKCSSLLVEAQHSMEFLSRTTLLYLLSSIISNASADSILRSRAMLITGRVLSNDNAFLFIDEPSYRNVISAIDRRFAFLGSQDADEFECALEAFGQIGLCKKGAAALLSSSPAPVRHVISAAFDCQHHGKRLAALHALGNIVGETRSGNDVLLDGDAEESLRRLIYDTSSKSPKLTPSGLLLSVLQQDSEIRLAGYRVITGLVARPWCLIEIISRQEIVDIVTNKYTETEKIGMEARHKCCEAVYESFTSSSKLMSDPARSGLATKLEEAIRSGPYLGRKHAEAQPVVMTEQRF